VVESERITAKELEELARDTGAADLPQQGEGEQVVARLEAASRVRKGEQADLWFNSEHLHLFDPETGKTMLGSPDGNGAGASQSPGSQTAQQAAGQPAADQPGSPAGGGTQGTPGQGTA
jgi:hypothetical protein